MYTYIMLHKNNNKIIKKTRRYMRTITKCNEMNCGGKGMKKRQQKMKTKIGATNEGKEICMLFNVNL